MGKSSSKLKSRRSQSIAWSFRFPSANGLHQALGSSRRRKKQQQRDGVVLVANSVSCKDLSSEGRDQRRGTLVASSSEIVLGDAAAPYSRSDSTDTIKAVGEEKAAGAAAQPPGCRDQEHEEPLLLPPRGSAPASGCSSPRASMSQEPVEESVRKLLERELRLFDLIDPRDLRSYAWYHGSSLPGGRKGAEAEIPNDGDFLVRDCSSQPGNYVLSVRHKGQALHFVINKLVLQPDTVYERVQYQLEDEAFDTVADLVTFYVGSKRPISQASGARIVNPRHRRLPLSSGCSAAFLAPGPSASSSSSSLSTSTRSPPRVPRKKERSQSLTAYQHYQSPPPPQLVPLQQQAPQLQSSTLPRVPPIGAGQQMSCSLSLGRQKICRVISDPALKFQQLQLQHQRQLEPSELQEPHYQTPRNNSAVLPAGSGAYDLPPPKPPRVPRHLKPPPLPPHPYHQQHQQHQSSKGQQQQASGSDSGNGSGDSEFEAGAHAAACALPMQPAMKGIIIRSYHQAKALGLSDLDIRQWQELERRILETTPNYEIASVLDLENFNTLLLPTVEHKPLDATALRAVTGMLYETASRVLASHLTKIDVDMLLKVHVEDPPNFRDGRCGLELLVLPYARQTRLDVIERTECLKLLVAVTVLTCGTPAERAATISRWIQVAIDTKTALGNLFGFCSIMLALCLPQIQRLTDTWHLLRQKHTDEAFTFEAKLRPTLRAMNECTDPQAPNTTIPHVLPIALLNERTHDDVLGNAPPSALAAAVLSPWENSAADCGLSIMWAHLEASRKMTENLTLFRRNAEIALEGCRSDELISDAFRTEFHVRFLWGSRGAFVNASERHAKFVQVLDAMYDKCAATEQQA
ncbi:breast cancer anti-estrogen resistance protein 3 [Nasonia vitripennis]|uniref:Breast cancer anti-estrogen resistance protein 3 n=1 Tax=Nasonia vitripennis TaxID=7425 RepID=A0A7M7G517_NASVI|nr:breast cancer anti-estrogen resistance protein 3 [Nasonia vitripennis]